MLRRALYSLLLLLLMYVCIHVVRAAESALIKTCKGFGFLVYLRRILAL